LNILIWNLQNLWFTEQNSDLSLCLIKNHATQKKNGYGGNAPCILTLAVD